ncbi:MAG: UDP-N-acetylmuramoyl-L-alanyl-D-glutamate--2,6-diaminopimelate ligase [Deltaproteobacteria bacterium]|nr:UDP-N-acetylmuramoyl-L-alanyl-D-glutamate--2,6-diaminopimelate ligase [Deltaproteobacteria bacterium]
MTRPVVTVGDLLDGIELVCLQGDRSTPVTGIACDTRRLGSGAVFVALTGGSLDGHAFLSEARQRGAAAVVTTRPVDVDVAVRIQVADAREALARMSSRFWGHPSRAMNLVGITGTNGKTTLTYLLEHILRAAGREAGVIGTVDARYAGKREQSPHTTPQAPELQALLARMHGAGVDTVCMEVSSHALELQRCRACHFRLGVFTNLSRDHLDFHGDLSRYAAAKRLLFSRELVESEAADKAAVLNGDDAAADGMIDGWNGAVLRYGTSRSFEIHPRGEADSSLRGVRAEVAFPGGSLRVASPLPGRHNLENLLAAVAVSRALAIDPEAIESGLQACRRVPGRLERVEAPAAGEAPAVFVDYAHTDHALRNVLAALRPLTLGHLIAVFGCGGDRDRGKRPLMGAAVARGADLAIVTSDNPRSEDPLSIVDSILPGLDGEGWQRVEPDRLAAAGRAAYSVLMDRREAIRCAIAMAGADDVVLVAGKGHEDYQIVGSERRHFDDREEVRRALEAEWSERGQR